MRNSFVARIARYVRLDDIRYVFIKDQLLSPNGHLKFPAVSDNDLRVSPFRDRGITDSAADSRIQRIQTRNRGITEFNLFLSGSEFLTVFVFFRGIADSTDPPCTG